MRVCTKCGKEQRISKIVSDCCKVLTCWEEDYDKLKIIPLKDKESD